MKKNFILCIVFLLLGVLGVKSEPVLLALHHDGNVTFFYDYQFEAAQDAAVEGDTIYISEGLFLGGITIKKSIHVIGSGEKTVINGDLNIEQSDNRTGYLVENLKINGFLRLAAGTQTDLRVRKLWIYYLSHGHDGGLTRGLFDRCQINGDAWVSYMEDVSFVNCKIGELSGDKGNALQFFNCNIITSQFKCFKDSSFNA